MNIDDRAIAHLGRSQCGVVSRRQLIEFGWTSSRIRAQVKAGRWQKTLRGIYATTNGELSTAAMWWSAYLTGGADSALDGRSALEAWGMLPAAMPVRIAVGASRGMTGVSDALVVVRHRWQRPSRRPRSLPPAVVPEHALIDFAQEADSQSHVLALIAYALQQGLMSERRLRDAVDRHRFVRHRRAFQFAVEQSCQGATTILEIDGVRNVLVGHGLPQGRGQIREVVDGRTVVRDRVIDPYGLIIEFDGRLGHADNRSRTRDQMRDNEALLTERKTLRFTYEACHELACEAAVQVYRAIKERGWTGALTPCGPDCRAMTKLARVRSAS